MLDFDDKYDILETTLCHLMAHMPKAAFSVTILTVGCGFSNIDFLNMRYITFKEY
jgi:hypothetical protein